MGDEITIEEFRKMEIRMGKVLSCEKVEGTDKLLKLQVDFGPAEQGSDERIMKQVISGIAESFTPEELVGRTFPFVVNLEYRKFRGEESQGMLMAIDVGDKTVLLEPSGKVEPGTEVV